MIDITSIKNAVLTLAMQGKMTVCENGDEPLDKTYSNILKEKELLLNLKRARRDKNINDDYSRKPFSIPDRWMWIKVAETGIFKKGPFGSSLTKSMFIPKSDSAIKVYEQQNAIQHDCSLGTYYISKEYFDSNMSGFEVNAGDIIVSCAGTIGETYIMPDDCPRGIINQALMKITLVPSVDKKYFLYYFDYSLKKDAQQGNGMAIVNIPPFDVLKNWLFPLPPLAEQRRIVEQVDKAFAILDRIDVVQAKFADNLEALKEKVIEAAMHGQLTEQLSSDSSIVEHLKRFSVSPSHNEDYNGIPDSWCCAQLSKICDLDTGNSIPEAVKKEKYQGYDGGYPYIGTKDVGFDHIVDYENGVRIPFNEPKFIVAENTSVLLCIEGGSAGRKIAIINQKVCYGNKLCKFYTTIINPRYIYYFLQSYSFKKLFKNKVTGLIGGVSISTLRKLTIPVPPVEEQQRIVEQLDNMLSIFDSMTVR